MPRESHPSLSLRIWDVHLDLKEFIVVDDKSSWFISQSHYRFSGIRGLETMNAAGRKVGLLVGVAECRMLLV